MTEPQQTQKALALHGMLGVVMNYINDFLSEIGGRAPFPATLKYLDESLCLPGIIREVTTRCFGNWFEVRAQAIGGEVA